MKVVSDKVSHPRRILTWPMMDKMKRIMAPIYEGVVKDYMANLSISLGKAAADLSFFPSFRQAFALDIDEEPTTKAARFLCALRYDLAGGRTFEIDPSLNFLLEYTDIGNKAPGALFQLPFDVIYFHLPINSLKITVGEFTLPLDGVYINKLSDEELEKKARQRLGELGPFDGYELYFISDCLENNPFKSIFLHTRLIIPHTWYDDPLEDILNRQMLVYQQMGKVNESNLTLDDLQKNLLELTSHVMKCLLFINSDEVITKEVNQLRELEAKEKRVANNKAKLRKIQQQKARAFNRIVVSHSPDENQKAVEAGLAGSTSRRAHWRRGHIRNQAYGEGRTLRKPKWIRPSLISGVGSKKQERVEDKNYIVK